MDILPAAPPPERSATVPAGSSWRRPTALVGLAGVSVPAWHLAAAALGLMEDDPGFMFAIIPFVMLGMLAASGVVLGLILVAAVTMLAGGRAVRLHALLVGVAAVFLGFTMAPFGGVVTTHGLVLIASGGLVVVALASPAAEQEVGPLLGLRHPREYVRPGVTPWWETWRDGLQAGLRPVEWLAVVGMALSTLTTIVLLTDRRRIPAVASLAVAMALAAYVEHGMRSRRASRGSRR